MLGAPTAGRCRSVPNPRPRVTNAQTPDERNALRLVGEATKAARRLRPVCRDWPEEQFGSLVYASALAQLRSELPPGDVANLRREYQAHREAYLARLGERAD